MKNLTEKQNEIVNSIIKEFTQINEAKKTKRVNKLIDFDGLLEQKRKDTERRKEIEISNRGHYEKFKTFVYETIDTLNEELNEYGLMAYLSKTKDNYADWTKHINAIYIYIDTIEQANKNKVNDEIRHTHHFSIRLSNKIKSLSFPSGIEYVYAYCGFNGFERNFSTYGTSYYPTLEEYLKDNSDFEKYLKNYIKSKEYLQFA